MTTMRQRWGQRRKPLPIPPDLLRRRQWPRPWGLADGLLIGLFVLLVSPWFLRPAPIASAWWLANFTLVFWNMAIAREGHVGDLARRSASSSRGLVVAWLLFIGVLAGIGYVVYWIATY
jgi:hypothetical protein